ncbi:Zinc finger BED domain-containing protein 5 [Trichinella spiralis]|uniref:Zinc finger BED domain-containing protein 5 n=1 Tax=Trichinella spiralis TaxID=6334 RepID=A0A0V1ARQ1_TRISP|nr:Zinc finger BED domain-containing protein 5 [Trichinella spiralis]
MDEWFIRKPVKIEVAEMESQKCSTAGDVNNKRKIDENESANFQLSNRQKVIRKYDIDYLKFGFTWYGGHKDPRLLCVICYEILANESMRPNKLLRHIEKKHIDLKSNPLQFFESKLKELNASQCVLSHFTNVNEKAMHASYLISLRIAQSGQPHTIGVPLQDAVGVLFGGTYLKEIELIPLSNDTAARRIEDMAKWVEDQLISRVKGSKYFSLQLDESTDIQGLSQLIEFNRFVWNSQPHEDILFCEPIIQGTSEEIFETLDAYVKSKELTAITVLVYVRMVHGQCVSDVVATGISTKADEELIDLSEDYSFKMSFDRKRLIQFWLSVQNTYPTLSTAALKVLLSFTTSYMREIGFIAMIGIKTKLRNKLQLSNNLRLKLTHISVDVEEVISQNGKQANCSHTPRYASH